MNRSDLPTRPVPADGLRAALHTAAATRRPDYLDDIVAQAARTRQRPAWTFAERWLPVSIAMRREGLPRAALLFSLVLLLVAAIALVITFAGAPRPLIPTAAVTNGLLAWASGSDLVVSRPDGSGRQTIVEGGGAIGTLAFAPDGMRIAFWRQNGEGWDLVTTDPDGSAPATVVTGAIEPSDPSWAPDGSRIAYVDRPVPGTATGSATGSYQAFVAPVDGSGPSQIGDPSLDVRGLSWSPDGSTLAFGAAPSRDVSLYRLHLMGPDGSNVRQVSDVRGNAFAFITTDWSHDGTKVAAQASDADNLGEWDIWIIDVRDGTATDVGAQVGGDEVLPSWAPDRDALAWATFDSVVVLEPGAAEPRRLPFGGIPGWSPDGRLLTVESDVGEIVVTDLDGAGSSIEGSSGMATWQAVLEGR